MGEQGLDAVLVSAEEALHLLGPGDVAVGRLDVLPTLDGVEPGLLSLLWLERAGVRVLNRAAALITVHDKLRTARCLGRSPAFRTRTRRAFAPVEGHRSSSRRSS